MGDVIHNSPTGRYRVVTMPAPRGRQQRGRSDVFHPDRSVRASVNLEPGDEDRAIYEWLLTDMGVSGAEVLRRAMRELACKRGYPVKFEEAAKQAS